MSANKPYFVLDALSQGLLPRNWNKDIIECAKHHEVRTLLTGEGSTSREKSGKQTLVVYVVEGEIISKELPWLWNLYANDFREFAESSFSRSLFVANLRHSAVNINVLKGKSARYEWHVDSNPVTGLLFVTSAELGDGGSLVFRSACGKTNFVRPKAGIFICFDARQLPHRVAPLKSQQHRISIPMNYYESDLCQPRPYDLDTQIYTAT